MPDVHPGPYPTGAMTRAGFALAAGALAGPALVGFILAAAASTPGYSHLSETVSQLGALGRPHPEIMSVGFGVFGALVCLFAAGVRGALPEGRGRTSAWLGLLIFGAAVALTGIFQDHDLRDGVAPSTEGDLHTLFATVAVLGLLIALLGTTRASNLPKPLGRASLVAFVAVLGLGAASVVSPGDIVGLVQRALYAVTVIWMAAVSIGLLRRS